MIPIDVIKYLIVSAGLVLSFFFALRFLFAHDHRRANWHSSVKRHIYMSRDTFKRTTIVLGWLCLLLGLWITYCLILDFVGA
jgi:NADH:ubiquinone oxidoreductase subunit 5 (subunit L)/multisubunit Na+/H+ antiporter MnhA subunit